MAHPAQIRNKQVTKHFTEKTIKEIWKEKMAANKTGAKTDDMCEFVCNYFQKRLGIMAAVVEVCPLWHTGVEKLPNGRVVGLVIGTAG